MPVIRLIRIPNLLIIALTMYLFRYCLIGKMLDLRGVWLGLSDTDFLLLTLSVIVIAAAGYIINDYFDVSIDAVNKPEKVIIGRHISPDTAFRIYVALNVLGIIAGFYLALKVGNYKLGFINLLSAGLLWLYSSLYKKKFLLGNLVIAFLSALVPLIVAFFEPMREYASFGFIKAYAAFAFLMTLVREIIKDIEDIEGDKAEGATTMPVYIGIIPSKIIAVFLSLLMLLFLGYV
jgi:4-hydroxybenzoate polyprenyltransferase